MNMSYKTGSVLCAQNCGLEVEIENNRIVKVKGDKSNVRSEGYVCRKGMNIANHQHNADRLKYPLKKVGSTFERISWEQAIDLIAEAGSLDMAEAFARLRRYARSSSIRLAEVAYQLVDGSLSTSGVLAGRRSSPRAGG